MNNFIYFDNAATTKPSQTALSAFTETAEQTFANPSSLHSAGLAAEKVVIRAAKVISSLLSANSEDIIFTSGGTESNNTAIFSAARNHKFKGKKIITTRAEHPSVLEPFAKLASEGFSVCYIPLNEYGEINEQDFLNQIDEDISLISLAIVNSETGTITQADKLAKLAKNKNPNVLFHADGVQAFGKIDFSLKNIDYLSVSAHKIHSTKGIGALWHKKGVPLSPLILGGGQQNGLRSGTENTFGISAFAAAATEIFSKKENNFYNVSNIKHFIREQLKSSVIFNSSENSSPYILNFSVPNIRSEVFLHALEAEGIFASSASACSSRKKGSSVLKACGLPKERYDTALRLSFSPYNTVEEAQQFVSVFNSILSYLRL
jgi:cysteine desulfurase